LPKLVTNNKFDIYQISDRLLGFYSELRVATELLKRGWDVYRPISDQYIDLIATKKITIRKQKSKKSKLVIRTLQVKASRLEQGGRKDTFGINPRPKDLLQDKRHRFCWVLYDKKAKENFFVMTPYDYTKWKNDDGTKYQEHTWLNNAQREHFYLDEVKQFAGLENLIKDRNNDFEKILSIQERNVFWKISGKTKTKKKWQKSQQHIIKNIPKKLYEKILEDDKKSSGIFNQLLKKYSIKTKLKSISSSSEGKIHFSKNSKFNESINRLIFTRINEGWAAYQHTTKSKKACFLKIICSNPKCKKRMGS